VKSAREFAAAELLDELEGSQLEVILVPQRIHTNEGGCVRVAISKNATWYRRFCVLYCSSRVRKNAAFDTKIKRAIVVRTLQAIADGRPVRSEYAQRLNPFIEDRARVVEGIYA